MNVTIGHLFTDNFIGCCLLCFQPEVLELMIQSFVYKEPHWSTASSLVFYLFIWLLIPYHWLTDWLAVATQYVHY